MTLRLVQLGTTRGGGEGLRIGAVRRPPRGVAFVKRYRTEMAVPEKARILRLLAAMSRRPSSPKHGRS